MTIDEIVLELYKATGIMNQNKKKSQFQQEKDELNRIIDAIYKAIEIMHALGGTENVR